ncbi:MAG: hypothetical protein ACRD2W_07865 [Acidimicrobiales bacterium]
MHRYRIVDDAALHEADFEELQDRAMNRELVASDATELGLEPTAEEVAADRARFLSRRGLTEESLDAWLADNDTDAARFHALMTAEASAHRMRRWFLGTLGYTRNRAAVADQLRIEGRYPEVADRAARRAKLAGAGRSKFPNTIEETTRVVAEHMGATGWRPSLPLAAWAEEFGLGDGVELLVALADASGARHEGARRRERFAHFFPSTTEPADG